ncbi:MAG: transcriptional regulator [Chloroflexi bacterium]|nr:transcriptional regulator [Chloroflexota bacterium]OQB02274.1 MAG: DRTGG domain protein [Chloroflexi bacterium ADurb.Bin222]HOC21783.1 transcriptional regulator [Anaerolineae bacterium]HOS79433.1 transcriptional regulator [Anaerolineae bacterium]HOV48491.1 transcriptional regulator [Anaerolineae bacterium]
MKVAEIVKAIEGEILTPPAVDVDLDRAFAADLMSDILVFAQPKMLMITGLTNPQTIRTAEMSDMPVILFVRGKRPSEALVRMAEEIGIGLLLSPYTMYETCGLLYDAGLPGMGKLPIVQQS